MRRDLEVVVVDFRSDGKRDERKDDVSCHDPLEFVVLLKDRGIAENIKV